MELHINLAHAALEAVGIDEADVTIRRAYSGRGTYGSTCFGIDLPTPAYARTFLASLAVHMEDNGEPWQELVWSATTDDMALGVVLYFPHWRLAEGEVA